MKHLEALKIVSTLPLSPLPMPTMLLGTHDGSFHCDEALALSILTIIPEYQKATIIRTRNPDYLSHCQLIVDVGAIFDHSMHRYDHHQKEFIGTFDEKHSIKLSSAGLIYKYFGKKIIESAFLTSEFKDQICSDSIIDVCYHKLYDSFIQHIDGIDNGIEVATGDIRYDISTTLSSRVGRFNPSWNEEQSSEISNKQFMKAMELTSSEFIAHLSDLVRHWLPARSLVVQAIEKRLSVHASGSIIILEHYCPWTSHLFDIETEMRIPPILYVLYADSGGSWRVQAVPEKEGSFASRKKLGPSSWHGLRDDALSEHANIPGCVFVHATGFIGGNKSKEGALAMAASAIDHA